MGAWFAAGGFGMLIIGVLGLASIFVAASSLAGHATGGKLRFLRAAPGLIAASAFFAFGTNLWNVGRHVSSHAGDDRVAWVGLFESAQPLTFGGALVAVAIAMSLLAEGRAKQA